MGCVDDAMVILCLSLSGDELMRMHVEPAYKIKNIRSALAGHLDQPAVRFQFVGGNSHEVLKDRDSVSLVNGCAVPSRIVAALHAWLPCLAWISAACSFRRPQTKLR